MLVFFGARAARVEDHFCPTRDSWAVADALPPPWLHMSYQVASSRAAWRDALFACVMVLLCVDFCGAIERVLSLGFTKRPPKSPSSDSVGPHSTALTIALHEKFPDIS